MEQRGFLSLLDIMDILLHARGVNVVYEQISDKNVRKEEYVVTRITTSSTKMARSRRSRGIQIYLLLRSIFHTGGGGGAGDKQTK